MNSIRLHLPYLTLLLACGWYFRHLTAVSEQEVNFLNGVTDELTEAVKRGNGEMRRHIYSTARAYRSNRVYVSSLHLADSLLSLPIAGNDHRSILISRLTELTTQTPEQIRYLESCLPAARQNSPSKVYRSLYVQNDALRLQLAQCLMLRYYVGVCSGEEIICFSSDIMASNITICPLAGALFQTDISLGDYHELQNDFRIRVNNRDIPIVQGRAHFEQIFPAPGAYPLAIRADYWEVDHDTMTSVEKTFILNVNR